MKKMIFLFLILGLIASCDSPQRGRGVTGSSSSSGLGSTFTPTPNFSGTTTGTISTGATTGSAIPNATPGLENCNLSPQYNLSALGSFGVCQSSIDETILVFRTSLTDSSVRTCLIPTYKDSSGSSMYLGQPQCTYTQQNVTIQGKLYKNRSGFESYPINAVMIMKEPLLTSYFNCMNAVANYYSQACPAGAATDNNCMSVAQQYQRQLCEQFKSQNAGSYADIRLK